MTRLVRQLTGLELTARFVLKGTKPGFHGQLPFTVWLGHGTETVEQLLVAFVELKVNGGLPVSAIGTGHDSARQQHTMNRCPGAGLCANPEMLAPESLVGDDRLSSWQLHVTRQRPESTPFVVGCRFIAQQP